MYKLDFGELHRRLIVYLQQTVQNGSMTERRLARITGISQPHIHQVLKGQKSLSTASADQILRALHNDILDFLDAGDRAEWNRRGDVVVE